VLRGWIHADFTSGLTTLEFYRASVFGKQGIVPAHPHIESRMKLGASLTEQNVPGFDLLAFVSFYTEILGIAISTIS